MLTGLDQQGNATSPPPPEIGEASQDRGPPLQGGPSHDRPVRAAPPSPHPTSSRSSAPAPNARTAHWSNDVPATNPTTRQEVMLTPHGTPIHRSW